MINAIPHLYGDPGVGFYYDIDASDEEDGSNVYFTTNSSMFTINYTSGVILFTPNGSNIGFHRINLTVNDTTDRKSYTVFNITIRDYNTRPNITLVKPSNVSVNFVNRTLFPNNITNVTYAENRTAVFVIRVNDSDSVNAC